MDPTIKFIFFLLAFVCFVVEFIRSNPAWNLIALGLALWVFVLLWQTGDQAF